MPYRTGFKISPFAIATVEMTESSLWDSSVTTFNLRLTTYNLQLTTYNYLFTDTAQQNPNDSADTAPSLRHSSWHFQISFRQ